MQNDFLKALAGAFSASPHTSPSGPMPAFVAKREQLHVQSQSGLAVTWLGHSTVFIEVEGQRLLIDPVWGERVSPLSFVGPKRFFAPPITLDDLPTPDAVLISHDHYDHLDRPTILALKNRQTRFIVPLGVGAHLTYWGVAEERITELDWWERAHVGNIEIVATPARHISGRLPGILAGRTLWCGYAMLGASRRVYYSGDTGLFSGLASIGDKLGPFDLTLIESGAYGNAWPDWHLGPEQAVLAHQLVRGQLMLPVHWGLFPLAFHAWTEPAERVLVAAAKAGVKVAIPRPGQTLEPLQHEALERWWPVIKGNTAEQDPIVATRLLAPIPRP